MFPPCVSPLWFTVVGPLRFPGVVPRGGVARSPPRAPWRQRVVRRWQRKIPRRTELLVVSQTSPMPHSFGTLRAFALKGLFGKKLVPSNCGNGCKHATRNHMQHQNETAKEKNLRSHLIHTLYHQNSSKFLCTVT